MSPAAFPPYNPPEIQEVSGWMRPDEMMMSDIPWAVAWYGDRQCAWITINSNYEFFQFNDYVKPVSRPVSDVQHHEQQIDFRMPAGRSGWLAEFRAANSCGQTNSVTIPTQVCAVWPEFQLVSDGPPALANRNEVTRRRAGGGRRCQTIRANPAGLRQQ